jgi:hypothetical protein
VRQRVRRTKLARAACSHDFIAAIASSMRWP